MFSCETSQVSCGTEVEGSSTSSHMKERELIATSSQGECWVTWGLQVGGANHKTKVQGQSQRVEAGSLSAKPLFLPPVHWWVQWSYCWMPVEQGCINRTRYNTVIKAGHRFSPSGNWRYRSKKNSKRPKNICSDLFWLAKWILWATEAWWEVAWRCMIHRPNNLEV